MYLLGGVPWQHASGYTSEIHVLGDGHSIEMAFFSGLLAMAILKLRAQLSG
jgi:hypothetical protein